MQALIQDLRYAIRLMAARRAFTVIAVLVLALGIGANSAIFSVVNAVLLRSLPFPDPDRIVMVFERDLQQHNQEAVAAANFLDWRDQNQTFQNMAAYREESFALTGGERPERVSGLLTTASLFPVLGVKPMLGRVFQPDEDSLGNNRIALISHGLWERRFAGDPNILGQQLTANGEPLTIIGVMPAQFRFPAEADLWVPPRQTVPEHVLSPTVNMSVNRNSHYLSAIGRLKPHVTLAQARADMDTVASRLEAQDPNNNMGRGVALVTLRDQTVGDIRPTLMVLFGAVAFVLMIACANVANLLLARASTRRKEIAIRTALGATRTRLMRQLLTESILLGGAGGGVGLLLALWGMKPLVALMPSDLYGAKNIEIDGKVLGFTVGVSLLTGLVFGLVPALHATRTDLNVSLKGGGRGGTGEARRNRPTRFLVTFEIALSLVLLIGAGLMIKSFVRLEQVNPGFETRNVVTLRLSLPATRYPDSQSRATFFQQVVSRLQSLPGVLAAGAVSRLPLTSGNSSRGLKIEGVQDDGFGNGPAGDYRVISPDYFRSMAIPISRGRDLNERDTRDAPAVVIINETMARRYWPDEDPLGKRLRVDTAGEPWMEIVGVVGDVKHFGLDSQSKAEIYVPYTKDPWPFMSLVVRSASDPASLADAIRSEVWGLDRDLPVPAIKTMDQLLAGSISGRRFNTLLLGIFASVALVLSAVGIYGVMSYSVAQRTQEIGIRLALGAKRSEVLKLVVWQGMTLSLTGIGIGFGAALGLSRVLTRLLFAVTATDPATFVIISILLTGVALAACLVPACRAMRLDPMTALRDE